MGNLRRVLYSQTGNFVPAKEDIGSKTKNCLISTT